MDPKLVKEKKREGMPVRYLWTALRVAVVVIIIGAAIVCFWQLFAAPCLDQKLLAASVLVPIGLGVFNMWKYFNSTKAFDKFLKQGEDRLAKQDEQIAQNDKRITQNEMAIKIQEEQLAIDKESRKEEKRKMEEDTRDRRGKSPF